MASDSAHRQGQGQGTASTALYHHLLHSPVGQLRLVSSDTSLVAVLWQGDDPRRVVLAGTVPGDAHPVLLRAAQELGEYFAGERTVFTVPLDLRGTEFQRRVWHALLDIPYGETRTYQQIAASVGTPSASRAVGAANGRNPVSILVPCHRVIGSSGKLTGFAGGLQAKASLLALEQQTPSLFAHGKTWLREETDTRLS